MHCWKYETLFRAHVHFEEPDSPQLRLIEVLSPDWEEAADLLGMSQHHVRIIRKDHGQSAEECSDRPLAL